MQGLSVPVLWNKKEKRIVNNSEDDICEMWAGVFKPLAKHPVDLFPEDLNPSRIVPVGPRLDWA